MVSIGSVYFLVPKLFGREQMYSIKLIDWHFWMSTIGVVLYIVAMWIAGIMQGLMWRAVNDDGTLTFARPDDELARAERLHDRPRIRHGAGGVARGQTCLGTPGPREQDGLGLLEVLLPDGLLAPESARPVARALRGETAVEQEFRLRDNLADTRDDRVHMTPQQRHQRDDSRRARTQPHGRAGGRPSRPSTSGETRQGGGHPAISRAASSS